MPNYTRIGVTKDKKDLIDVLATVSKNSMALFTQLKQSRNPSTNMATLLPTTSPTEANAQTLALRELNKVGLVRKVPVRLLENESGYLIQVPKRTHIINPYYMFPRTNEDFDVALSYWKQVKPKKKKPQPKREEV